MHRSTVRTAIFPVAGLGTRFLPATKATPKELLPVIDRPLIQYAIDEARAAGIERMVFVNHPSKSAIRDYVLQNANLTALLRDRNKNAEAAMLESLALDGEENAVFASQPEPLGLGHAVMCARPHVLDGPVAVILPDDLIVGEPGCLSEMIEVYDSTAAGHIVAVMRVLPEEVSRYGILSVSERNGALESANGMVEKPSPDTAPSRTAVVGRYVLDPSVFDALETQAPGAGGEIQLTDAIARGIDTVGLAGFHFSGERFDCGSKAGMLAATLRLASRRDEFDSVLNRFIAEAGTCADARIAAE